MSLYSNLLIFGLSVALLWTLGIVWRQRSATRGLLTALRARRPLLHEDGPEIVSRDWQALCGEVVDVLNDVTRLTRLHSGQIAQLEATLGSLKEAVLLVDSGNRILLANSALRDIFLRDGPILGLRLEAVFHSAAFLAYVDTVRRGEALAHVEIEFVGSGQVIWVEATGSIVPSLRSGDEVGPLLLFVLHDITRQKRLEGMRKEFVANVSHELRTPLSVIKGYAETLVDEHASMPAEERDKFLKTIQRHGERLNSLLEDLLALSRLESASPGLKREAVVWAGLVVAVREDFEVRPQAATHRLVFTFDEQSGREMHIDPLKISQVFENLLSNALKYTPPGASIEVGSRLVGVEMQVWVRDNGPGIPPADLPHIFERFYRVDKGRSRETGGTGLGLSIVKHIVQLHGGRVWAESRVGEGSTFYFTLPVR